MPELMIVNYDNDATVFHQIISSVAPNFYHVTVRMSDLSLSLSLAISLTFGPQTALLNLPQLCKEIKLHKKEIKVKIFEIPHFSAFSHVHYHIICRRSKCMSCYKCILTLTCPSFSRKFENLNY